MRRPKINTSYDVRPEVKFFSGNYGHVFHHSDSFDPQMYLHKIGIA